MADSQEKLLFPGCMIGNRIPFIEASARKVFDKLGVKVLDAPFGCCPDPVGFQSTDKESWLALGARNLCIAEEQGKSIVSLCNGCTQTLTAVNQKLKHDAHKKSKVNSMLNSVGKEFKGTIDVYHFVRLLKEEVGINKIKETVTNPLKGLKIACHTGCHYSRPSEIMQYDDPFEPKVLRELVAATGAEVIDYEEEALCCGVGAGNAEEDVGLLVLKRKMDSIVKSGADYIAVICPSCFQQMDGNQRNLQKKFEQEYDIPILYLTEILALAMGYTYDDLNLRRHRVKPKALQNKE
ncbi:MAG: CoB--CoM heterodisulfide reductase subunit B [Candidatus Lokiarchaeota archaeon]|nr:CoB--CoM heterodisulfide reductase subunit B [Candidatus Lokiarchaeota archaeon]